MKAMKVRLAVLVAFVGGLYMLTALRADDKAKTPTPPASEKRTDAIKPKPLGDEVKKGLEYLVKQQHSNGGWGQGGGWRTVENGGRIEGAQVQDPPDVGNTCIATLALIRAGNTAKDGAYAKNVAKAIEFICGHVEKSDEKSLYVTNLKGTQLHSKIGPFVDTFLTSLVLSELKGNMPDEKSEKVLMASLTKTIKKIELNQKADGTFAGNNGWASVLSQGLAGKGLARAAQNGVAVNPQSLERIQEQVASNFDGKAGEFKSSVGAGGGIASARGGRTAGAGAGGVTATSGAAKPSPAGAPSDAGVPLYAAGQGLTNLADVSAAQKREGVQARKTLDDKDAKKEDKEKAQETLKKIEETERFRTEATKSVVKQLDRPEFVRGFGSNGGEEFLSFMNIGEALLMKGGEDFKKWDKVMTEGIVRVQDKDGSWSGQHCITGKTFCTASALLVLMSDRAPLTTTADSKK